MKSKLTTTFALIGVLAAGTAAAAVNTQALQSRAESTIAAGTTTLIAPTTEPVALDTSATPSVIELDTSATPVVSPATAVPDASQAPAKKKKAKAKSKATSGAVYSNPNPSNGDDDEDEGEDDD
jgi:hypothetical protein